jgi:predicted Zn-dependent protease
LKSGRRHIPEIGEARNQLGVVYCALGQYEKALAVFREALQLYPQSGLARSSLIFTYVALNRLGEARVTADEAKIKNADSPGLRINLYRLAFLQNDPLGMERQVAVAAGKPGLEDALLWNEAATASYFGRLERARMFDRRAIASAQRAEENEAAAGYRAEEAAREALFGYTAEARQRAATALRASTGPDLQYRVALALALTGDATRSKTLAEDLGQRFPEDTIVQFVYLPTLHAQLALGRNGPLTAIEALQSAIPYELGNGLYPAYVRGVAYLAAHRGDQAQSEFGKILTQSGIVLNSAIGALAHLQIGKAFVCSKHAPHIKTSSYCGRTRTLMFLS